MKVFKIILLFTFSLFALSSIVQEALKYYQNNNLEHHPRAVKALVKEAENGNHDAAFLLATAYKNAKLGSEDLDKAYHFYELSAKSGDADAMLMLGWLEYKGTPEYGIRLSKAKYWFKEASKLGVVEASEMLELINN